MNNVEMEKFEETHDPNGGVKFFKGVCFGTLLSIPIWVIIGLAIRQIWFV